MIDNRAGERGHFQSRMDGMMGAGVWGGGREGGVHVC